MMKAYVLIIGAENTRQEFQGFLNGVPEVPYWYACLPNSIFFTSSLSAAELAKRMEPVFPGPANTYVIMEVGKNRQGWLPREAWQVIGQPDSLQLSDTGKSRA